MLSSYIVSNYKFIFWPIIAMLLCSHLFAQQKNIIYRIINKSGTIGQMQITQRVAGEDVFFGVISLIETRVLMNIKVNVQEESHYHKGKLVSSSSQRFVNDKPKGKKETRAEINCYVLTDDNKADTLNQKSITYNFPKLYFTEPINITNIYSDYYQKNLVIQPQDNHSYKIDLPEGGSNIYYYEDGICKKVDIHGALFNAQMILNE